MHEIIEGRYQRQHRLYGCNANTTTNNFAHHQSQLKKHSAFATTQQNPEAWKLWKCFVQVRKNKNQKKIMVSFKGLIEQKIKN